MYGSPAPSHRAPIAATVILVGLAFVSLLPVGLSIMLFDAPGSEKNPYLLVAFGGIASFPVTCVAAVVCAWIAHGLRRDRVAARVVFLPLLSVAVAIVGIALLSVICHGNTRC